VIAAAWIQGDAALRRAITSAVHRIDQTLQGDPNNAGESRPGGRRILLVSPVGVIYRIEKDGRTASVLRSWLFRPKS
jgi:hypothetical protein